MTNEQLDHQLRQLFEADRRSIDPNGAAALALLDSITAEPVEDSQPGETTRHDENSLVPSFEDNVISLGEPARAPSRGRILLVAAVILAALLGLSRWLLPFADEAPVISEDVDNFDVNGAEEIVPETFVVGAAEPHVLILDGDGSQATVLDCFVPSAAPAVTRLPLGDEDSVFEEAPWFEGTSILGFVSSTSTTFVDLDFAALDTTGQQQACSLFANSDISTSITDPQLSFQSAPIEMSVTASPSADSGRIIPPGEDIVIAIGQHDGSVVGVTVPDLSADDQRFVMFGDNWFVLEYRGTNHVPADIEFADGTTERLQLASSEFRTSGSLGNCDDDQCLIDFVADRFAELADEAASAGADRQAAFLSSGVLSQVEYDAAEEAFLECLDQASIVFIPPLLLEAGSAEADAAQRCYEAEIAFIEQARFLQNEITPVDFTDFPELGVPGLDEDAADDTEGIEEPSSDTDSLIAEARQLFGGGLSREEIDELWDGYPYSSEDRDVQIDRYLTDFAWMQEGIVVEVALFEQFRGSGNFQPIVSAQSLDDRSLATAFVLGVIDDELVIRRLPEADRELLSTYDAFTNTVSTPVVGIEGGVTAFLEGVELAVLPVGEGEDTTFALPSGFTSDSVVLVVGATPEEPGAEAVVLNFEEQTR